MANLNFFKSLFKSKRAFEMSFNWIFALIAGAAILFIAIYGVTQFIGTAQHASYTEAATAVSMLFDPLETESASLISQVITFRKETRTLYQCFKPDELNPFGRQTIAFSEESGFGRKWADFGGEKTIKNKFLFSNTTEQGIKLYAFTKPFYTGFKVADLTIVSSQTYCFANPPEKILDSSVNLKNVNISDSVINCPEKSVKVCFNTAGGTMFSEQTCDVRVYDDFDGSFDRGYVFKGTDRVYFIGNLVFAAIFSSPDKYECNIKRLGIKMSELAKVYKAKADYVSTKSCNSLIKPQLEELETVGKTIRTSNEMLGVYDIAKQMDELNEDTTCEIYSGA